MCYNNFCQQDKVLIKIKCRCGETGRRTGLKILRDQSSHAGSIPAICTNDVSVRTSYRTDDMKINQKWLIFFYCEKSHPIPKRKDGDRNANS